VASLQDDSVGVATALSPVGAGHFKFYHTTFIVGLGLGLDPNGHNKGMTGPVGYWPVNNIKESLQSLLDAGAQMQEEIKDVGGGKLIASVKDADSNIIGLIQSP